jgi:hypothetical protein
MSKYACPCCGYFTLDRPLDRYEICPLCWWEADAEQSRNPLCEEGPNLLSLEQARQRFLRQGVTDDKFTPQSGPPDARFYPPPPPIKGNLDLEDVRDRVRNLQEDERWRESLHDARGNHQRKTPETLERFRREQGRRAPFRLHYGNLYDELRVLFSYHDPIQIDTDPTLRPAYTIYDSQVEGIFPQVIEQSSAHGVTEIVRRELARWFQPPVVPPEDRLLALAQDIWRAVQRYSDRADAASGC